MDSKDHASKGNAQRVVQGETMKTILYYFTGTGNSLAVAKKISTGLGDCELVSISSLQEQEHITPEANRVGIICPDYFLGLPVMVSSFIKRIDLSQVPYLFSVVTYGESGDVSVLTQIDDSIRKRSNRGLSAGFSVRMPGNYILLYNPPTGTKQQAILKSADQKIQNIINDITQGKKLPLKRSLLWSLLHTLFYPRFVSGVHNKDTLFTVTDACTSCGICSDICPADNIEMMNNKPVWKHQCELCCGCIHLCPVHAIQAGKKTAGRAQYRNPDVSVSELRHHRQTEANKPDYLEMKVE